MKGNKIALLMVAILAIGIFALPSTMAMFGGQHNWYDLQDDGNQVPCEKCHADIFEEFENSGIHKTLAGGTDPTSSTFGEGYDTKMACDACHRVSINNTVTFASGDGVGSTPGKEAHAAATIACMECHQWDANFNNFVGAGERFPIYAPFAGGFTNMSNVSALDTWASNNRMYNYTENGSGNYSVNGSKAAHNDFIVGAILDPLMEDSNEACITCHTHVAIDINWTHAYTMQLNATQDSAGNWDCDKFKTAGSYNITTYGNMTGGTNSTSNLVVKNATGDIVADP